MTTTLPTEARVRAMLHAITAVRISFEAHLLRRESLLYISRISPGQSPHSAAATDTPRSPIFSTSERRNRGAVRGDAGDRENRRA